MLKDMLFVIPAKDHSRDRLKEIFSEHPEVKFVTLVGLDMGGNATDEKIPVDLFLEDFDKFMSQGVQTDGSSVVLPKIATLNNAKVDIIPDPDVNWYVDHNWSYMDEETGLPLGTLRIPAFLVHNDTNKVGSRVVLKEAVNAFKRDIVEMIRQNPYVLEHLPIDSADDIEEVILTSATELEFWVKTPEEDANGEQLSTSQVLKEQYWKRLIGPVRTAMEHTLLILDQYGFGVEMGHKEVGGAKAQLSHSGNFEHIMEQLEIDWKYADAIQAADNERNVKYIVKDIFRLHGLDVTFRAKPVADVAGSGEHTHMGVAARLKNGKMVSLFAAVDPTKEFMNPIGFGALMGILKNYEIMNPFVTATNDALNRLKPGFEAPVCIVTSLGHEANVPSRNRTVLVGLIRDAKNPLATRFELRSPNPKSDTYLVLAAGIMAMLDGIEAALKAGKTPADLERSISKKFGEDDFYLEKYRAYRTEKNVFTDFTQDERDKFFGRAPATVWENICAFDKYPDKLSVLNRDNVMTPLCLESYKAATIAQWATELRNRLVPDAMDLVRECKMRHDRYECTDLDEMRWTKIKHMRAELGQNDIGRDCLLSRLANALDAEDYDTASDLQIEMQEKLQELSQNYILYLRNLL
ncbi:MAG: glutamine synthetase [Firmicutes bacterium]|nr:glutamine synthetase [Bacillota bacterium]